jgi:hypothetical protein
MAKRKASKLTSEKKISITNSSKSSKRKTKKSAQLTSVLTTASPVTPKTDLKPKKKSSKPKSQSNKKSKADTSGSIKPEAKFNSPQGIQKKGRSLEPLREKLRPMVDEANKRFSQLITAGMYSHAIDSAIRSVSARRRDEFEKGESSNQFFSIEGKNYRELRTELARVQEFINDPTSTILGAKLDVSRLAIFYEGGKAFATEESRREADINEQYARWAFAAYREIERNAPNLIYEEGGYGSDNLINVVYQAVVDLPDYIKAAYFTKRKDEDDPVTSFVTHDIIEALYNRSIERQNFAQMDRAENSPDSDIIEKVVHSKSAEEFWDSIGF